MEKHVRINNSKSVECESTHPPAQQSPSPRVPVWAAEPHPPSRVPTRLQDRLPQAAHGQGKPHEPSQGAPGSRPRPLQATRAGSREGQPVLRARGGPCGPRRLLHLQPGREEPSNPGSSPLPPRQPHGRWRCTGSERRAPGGGMWLSIQAGAGRGPAERPAPPRRRQVAAGSLLLSSCCREPSVHVAELCAPSSCLRGVKCWVPGRRRAAGLQGAPLPRALT